MSSYKELIILKQRQQAKKVKSVDQTDGRMSVSNYMDRIRYGFMEDPEAQEQYKDLVAKYTKQLVTQWEAELKQLTGRKTNSANSVGLELAQLRHDYNHG